MNTISRLAAAAIGLAAIVSGASQLASCTGAGMPTPAEVRKIAEDAQADMIRTELPELGLSLLRPRGWEQKTNATGPLYFEFKTLGGILNGSLASESVPADTLLMDYVKANRVEIEKLHQTRATVTPPAYSNLPGAVQNHSANLTLAFDQPDAGMVQVTQRYFIRGTRSYILAVTTPQALHDEMLPLFDAMFASIEFK